MNSKPVAKAFHGIPPLVLAYLIAAPGTVHADSTHGDAPLHFSHPLIAESPSPDTKLRFDYFYANETGEEKAKRHTLRLEGEYAFARWISAEVDAPYTFLDPDEGSSVDDFGDVEVGLKLANFYFEERGLLLGGGIEFGLPTGNGSKGIGSNHVLEIEPFLDFGYKVSKLEAVGFLSFGIPTNTNGEDLADVELGWNLSLLYHATPKLEAILEFDGENVFGGEEDGETILNVTPGIKFAPFEEQRLMLGAGVSLPLTNDKSFHVQPVVSVFYHF